MKSLFKSIAFIAFSLLAFACHDNKEDLPVGPEDPVDMTNMPEINGKVYNVGDNFTLETWYMGSGGSFPDKICLGEGQHASISFDGKDAGILKFYTDNLDLSTIDGNPVKGEVARPSLMCFGTEVSIPLKIVPYYGSKKYKLSGEIETAGVKIAVKNGNVTSDGFSAQFEEGFVFREDHSSGFKFGGAYNMIDLPEHDSSYHYTVSPFVVSLESRAYPEERAMTISLSDVMQVLLNTPVFKESDYGFDRAEVRFISISTLWGRLVPGIIIPDAVRIDPLSFKIIEVYGDEELYSSGRFRGYPSNTFCASDVTESSYRLSIDPAKVFKFKIVKSKTENGVELFALNTPDLYSLISNIFLLLTPMNAEGIKMEYAIVDENGESKFKSTFSDRALGLSVLKTILCSVYRDSTVAERMKSTLESEGMDAETLECVAFVANNLENILNNASGATFGWSYCGVNYYYLIGLDYYYKLYEN